MSQGNARPTPGYNAVLDIAKFEASRLKSREIKVEHYLLALLKRGEGLGFSALRDTGVDIEAMIAEVESRCVPNTNPFDSQSYAITGVDARAVQKKSQEICAARMETHLGTEHLLLALIMEKGTVANAVLEQFNVTVETITEYIDKQTNRFDATPDTSEEDEDAAAEGMEDDEESFDSYEDEDAAASQLSRGPRSSKSRRLQDEINQMSNIRRIRLHNREHQKKKKMLDLYTRDLTQLSREKKIDPVIGRDQEIERMLQVLCRRKKNNPVLLGESGVGKTAVVEGLALRIASDDVPDLLKDHSILSLDMGALVAGTKFRGEFEERLDGIIKEVRQNPNIILFIDEMHTILGTGHAEGSLDAAAILKPALARGELQCIGATTSEEYRKFVRKDAALTRRFQPIEIKEPNVALTLDILNHLKTYYEEHHGVRYTQEAIVNAAELSNRYITDRHLPDKAIDLLDEVGAKMRLKTSTRPPELSNLDTQIVEIVNKINEESSKQNFALCATLKSQRDDLLVKRKTAEDEWKSLKTAATITGEDIAELVSSWTGIPVTKVAADESKKLLVLEDTLAKRIVSQKQALNALGRAIRRSRAGLKEPNRPMASFLFLGPTGVGKTELAKALAEFMFGTEDAMVRIDMSEYNERISVTRLIGAPPGYVGHDSPGQLTEKVRQHPYSVVLLDEVEKACPEVFNLLLQVLDDGRLTDATGETISFANTIIIMTSNAGTRDLHKASFGFSEGDDAVDKSFIENKVKQAVKQTFSPEFLNRLDETLIFEPLTKTDLDQIVTILIGHVNQRLQERGIVIELRPAARDFLCHDGYAPEFGARPMRRSIQKHIEDPLSQYILEGKTRKGMRIYVDAKDDKLTFEMVEPPEVPAVPEESAPMSPVEATPADPIDAATPTKTA